MADIATSPSLSLVSLFCWSVVAVGHGGRTGGPDAAGGLKDEYDEAGNAIMAAKFLLADDNNGDEAILHHLQVSEITSDGRLPNNKLA